MPPLVWFLIAGLALLVGGAAASGLPATFHLLRHSYRDITDWAADRGKQIRDAFGIPIDMLRPVAESRPGTRPQDYSADDWNRRKLSTLTPSFRPRFVRFVSEAQAIARANGRELLVWQAARPLEKQVGYVQSGSSQTISSRHLFGLAVDLALRHPTTGGYDGPCDNCTSNRWPSWYGQVVAAAKRNRLFWGGDWASFPDVVHFEVPESEWPPSVASAAGQLRDDARRAGIA